MNAKHKFNKTFSNILSIVVMLVMAFPVTGAAYAQDPAPKVGLVLNAATTQDNDFNWMAQQGLLQAESELGVIASEYQPSNQGEYDSVLQQCADENDLCIAVGFDFVISLANVARVNPDTKWAAVDLSYPDCWEGAEEGVNCGSFTELLNVRGLRFNEKQAGYLVGVLAGGMTASNTVGAVGGMEIPPVVAFLEGYRNGAQCTNPAVNVLTAYTGTFVDPDLGASTAQGMMEQGADVIFGAAGLTGNGAIQYSAQSGQWVIGVDTDQYFTVFGNGTVTGSDKILSSAMKRVDSVVYQTIADFVNEAFTSGTVFYDLAMDGVGLAPFHETDGSISQEFKDNIEAVKQGIIDGTVNIDDPCAPPPTPWLIAFPEGDAVEGWEWPDGATVYLTIDNAPEGFIREGTAQVTSWGDPRTYVRIEFWDAYDLQAGDVVTMFTDGLPPVSHEVQELDVTAADGDTDTVAGTAYIGAMVQVWPHGYDQDFFIEYQVIDGTWLADFGSLGFYNIEETGGRSQIMVGSNATAVDWRVQKPRITVYQVWNAVEAWDWPDGVWVTATIQDKPECVAGGESVADQWGTNVWINFPETCDVVIGDEVILGAEGVTSVSHTVRNLSVTEVDADAETVSGMADEGVTVYVWPHMPDAYEVQPTADGGVWEADFSGFGDVLQPGMDGRSEVRDDYGNSTAVDWHIPKPRFTVYPAWNAVEGWDWPADVLVTAVVSGNEENCTTDGYPTADPWGTNVWMNFPESCDVMAGNEVILSAEGVPDVSHMVQNLSVTEVNAEDDFVAGTADEGVTVYVWPHGFGEYEVQPTADGGVWEADFSGLEEDILQPGMDGRSEVRDDYGNSTAVDWHAPKPRFTVYPEWEAVEAWDWPDGVIVTATIVGKDCLAEGVSGYPEWDPWTTNVWMNFPEGCDVAAGDVVILSSDGVVDVSHTVLNLLVTKVEPGNDVVKGTADAGAEIHVWPHATGQEQIVTANPRGKWNVGFLGIYDLTPGDGGRAEIRDEDGNATAVDWYIPKPRIVASITEDWFFLQEFSPNATLSFTVYEIQYGKLIWKGTTTTDESGFVWVDAEGRWDLEPGNYLFARDGSNSKGLVIEGFTLDVFDLASGQLSGTAPEPYGRNVWVGIGWEDHVWDMQVTTDEAGAWFADFGQPVPADYQWVAAQIFDEDGDSTELRPDQIVNLWVAAFTFDPPAGTFIEDGEYPYHFELEWTFPEEGSWSGQGGELDISGAAEVYDGYVLLRGTRELMGVRSPEGLSCEEVFNVNPGQPMRFLFGWVTDYGMTYDDALAHFDSMTVRVVWGDGNSADLTGHEVMPYSFNNVDAWLSYACLFSGNFTLPAKAGWMDSGIDVTAGTELTITAYGEAATADLNWYPNSFSGPDGQDGLGCGDYEVAPPPCALDYGPYGALVGKIGNDGEPFFIGANFTFTPTVSGELYLAVNDNLGFYEDNSGAYGIFIK